MKVSSLRQVAIASNDLVVSREFYQNTLGMTFVAEYDPPGLVFFDLQGTRLLIEKGATASTLYFWVDDIDASFAELSDAGVVFESTPHMIFRDSDGVFGTASEEEWMAFFKDPAGNTLALATRKSITSES